MHDEKERSEQVISELRHRLTTLEAEHQHAQHEALETKRYLAQLIDSSTDAIITTDREGNVLLCNEGAQTLLGYPAEEIVGRPVSRLFSSESVANDATREIRKRGGSLSGFESHLRAKDGSNIPVLIASSIVYDDKGQEAGTIRVATDLRERKRAEDAFQKVRDELEERVEERTTELRMARERFQYLLTVTPGIIYTNKGSGDFACTFVSENVDPIMGFSAWEMLEDPGFWYSRLHPEDAPRVAKEVRPLLEQGGGTLEYRFRHRDGHFVWIQDTFRVLYDAVGQPSELVGAWADISYHKQAQEALGERMAIAKDLQTLVAASPSVIYTTTQASGSYACRFVSENLKSIMSYAPWEMRDDPTFWVKHLHPEDAPRVFAEVDKLIAQGGGTIEYRFRHRKGHFIWVQDTFKVIYDNEGKPKEIVGSWADTSARKQVEFELQQLARQVELRNKFIRETFGRYLTDEVVTNLLESPTGLEIGGEKCKITMMMADLRGFTSLSERLAPERVVSMLNCYLTTMISIIKQYRGTIDEFIGDAIFVLFGAPVWQEDRCRACRCLRRRDAVGNDVD
jgi:PAS domain S-box-containing protein